MPALVLLLAWVGRVGGSPSAAPTATEAVTGADTAKVAAGALQQLESFDIMGPGQLQELAMDAFSARRKLHPAETLDADSYLMIRAKAAAVYRGATKGEAQFSMRGAGLEELGVPEQLRLLGDGSETGTGADAGTASQAQAHLPQGDALTAAVRSHGSGSDLAAVGASLAHNAARAVAFNEQIGGGALSQAGALPMGAQGQWIELAEGKLRRDAELSHSALLWELGSELAEAEAASAALSTITTDTSAAAAAAEEEAVAALQSWVLSLGGSLPLSEVQMGGHNTSSGSGSRGGGAALLATEALQEGDVAAALPFRALMCRQTARNVLVGRTGRCVHLSLSLSLCRVCECVCCSSH